MIDIPNRCTPREEGGNVRQSSDIPPTRVQREGQTHIGKWPESLCNVKVNNRCPSWSGCGVPHEEHVESRLDWEVNEGRDLVFTHNSGNSA